MFRTLVKPFRYPVRVTNFSYCNKGNYIVVEQDKVDNAETGVVWLKLNRPTKVVNPKLVVIILY